MEKKYYKESTPLKTAADTHGAYAVKFSNQTIIRLDARAIYKDINDEKITEDDLVTILNFIDSYCLGGIKK